MGDAQGKQMYKVQYQNAPGYRAGKFIGHCTNKKCGLMLADFDGVPPKCPACGTKGVTSHVDKLAEQQA